MKRAQSHKKCMVPACGNSTVNFPNKTFLRVPDNKVLRALWLKAAKRDAPLLGTKYACEDHFDLPNDLKHYMQQTLPGYKNVHRKQLKKGVLPHKFSCQDENIEKDPIASPSSESSEHQVEHNEKVKIEGQENSTETRNKTIVDNQNIDDTDTDTIIKQEFISESDEEFIIKEEIIDDEIPIEEAMNYKCDMCEYETTFYSNFVIHVDVCNNIKKDDIQKMTKYNNTQIDYDNESFDNTNDKTNNEISVKGEKQETTNIEIEVDNDLTCTICRKKFSNKSNLRVHSMVHTGEKPYRCKICDKTFTANKTLKTHMRSHTGEKPFECNICNKTFAANPTLKAHMRIHTGEKPYKCEVCEKCFSFAGSLISHKKIHTGEKPYECELCHKTFSILSTLRSHMNIHTREKVAHDCTLCDKKYCVFIQD